MGDLNWLTAEEMAAGYRAGRFTPAEVLEDCLAQAALWEPRLNALTLTDAEGARAQATAAGARIAAGKALSPLDGVPALIKDILLTRGQPCLRGSWTVDAAGPWEADAPSVARLREAGAVLMARTTTPEIGWKGITDSPRAGITRNPWDVATTPGGSSGGSSAAVAAGYAPLALGTDGGGSIRIPAGFAGIYGLKPSFGRVPAWPLSPFGTVAHVGPMTRTARDSALMMDVIARPDARDWHALPHDPTSHVTEGASLKGLRIAFSADLGYVTVHPEIAALVRAAVDRMADAGAEVVETDPGFDDPVEIFRTLWWAGAKAALAHVTDRSVLDPNLAIMLGEADGITLDAYMAATRARGALGAQMRAFMEGFDLLVTPSLPIPAFGAGLLMPSDSNPALNWMGWTPFSYPFNLTQQPAASVPCGFTSAGLPAGVQLVGRMFDDRGVLAASEAVERALALPPRRPV